MKMQYKQMMQEESCVFDRNSGWQTRFFSLKLDNVVCRNFEFQAIEETTENQFVCYN